MTREMLQKLIDAAQTGVRRANLMEDAEFSCVMAPASPDLADAVVRWGEMFVTDDVLYKDEKDPDGFGREDKIHVTVKFGLNETKPSEELLHILQETPPFEIEIGPCTLFDDNDLYDVVKFDVDSDALRELNARISELPNSDKFPEYHPHMTVAYVTKGTCNELIGKPLLDPEYEPALRFLVKTVVFSSPTKTKTTLFLGKPNLEPEPVREAEEFDPDEEEDTETAKDVHDVAGPEFKNFTDADLEQWGAYPSIMADRSELIRAPTGWQKMGLHQTATGYGAKLNTGLKISFNGKLYRLYSTCYGNAASVWFVTRGRKIFIN